ncbi:hypothetical protein D3C75_777350 [compost metagenome]
MATGNVNSKSQMKNIRFPHDVLEGIEELKQDGESTAAFVVTAVRGEIARRQSEGNSDNPLLSTLDALTRIKEIGNRAGKEIELLIGVAESELQTRKPNE